MLPGLHHEIQRVSAFDDVLTLVASEPQDAEDVGGDHEHGIRVDPLEPILCLHLMLLDGSVEVGCSFFGLQLVQLGNALEGVDVLLGILGDLLQLGEQRFDLSIELGFDLALDRHYSPYIEVSL